jgi:hypothetical protein
MFMLRQICEDNSYSIASKSNADMGILNATQRAVTDFPVTALQALERREYYGVPAPYHRKICDC